MTHKPLLVHYPSMSNRFLRRAGASEIVKKLAAKAILERNLIEDNDISEFHSIGLFDSMGRLKPAFKKLAIFRKTYID